MASGFTPEELDALELELEGEEAEDPVPEWPQDDAVVQISAVKEVLAKGPGTAAAISDRFQGTEQNLVGHHLATPVPMGKARETDDGRIHPVEKPAVLYSSS